MHSNNVQHVFNLCCNYIITCLIPLRWVHLLWNTLLFSFSYKLKFKSFENLYIYNTAWKFFKTLNNFSRNIWLKILEYINILFRQILFLLDESKYSNIRHSAKLNSSTSPNSTRMPTFSRFAAYDSTFSFCGTKTIPLVSLLQDTPSRIVTTPTKTFSWISGMTLKAWAKRVISVPTASENKNSEDT